MSNPVVECKTTGFSHFDRAVVDKNILALAVFC
jgi:hypothetical protein